MQHIFTGPPSASDVSGLIYADRMIMDKKHLHTCSTRMWACRPSIVSMVQQQVASTERFVRTAAGRGSTTTIIVFFIIFIIASSISSRLGHRSVPRRRRHIPSTSDKHLSRRQTLLPPVLGHLRMRTQQIHDYKDLFPLYGCAARCEQQSAISLAQRYVARHRCNAQRSAAVVETGLKTQTGNAVRCKLTAKAPPFYLRQRKEVMFSPQSVCLSVR